MVVILLNPNQQLIINNFQSDFIKAHFQNCTKIVKNYQKMIPLDFLEKDLKSLVNSINKVTIYEPQIKDFSNDFTNPFYNLKQPFDFSLSSKIELCIDNKTYVFDYPLAFFNPKDDNKVDFSGPKKIGTNIFPLPIKVFRVGKCLCQNNTFILEDSVWKKLK